MFWWSEKHLSEPKSHKREVALNRMAAMLGLLGARGYQMKEGPAAYGFEQIDFDPEETKGPRHVSNAS